LARARRTLASAATIAAIVAVLAPSLAGAQSLRLLHVEALGMRADHTHVRVGEIFHLAIHVRVAENVSALDELVIPDVGRLQLLGDERHTTHAAHATDVVETLTLDATETGRYTFAPAYLDAIDPHDLRPKRYSANHGITVVVASPAVVARRDPWAIGRSLASAVAVVVIGAVLGLALLGRIRPRRERSPVPDVALYWKNAPPAPPPPPPPATPRERVAEALRAYRRSPGRVALEKLRAALFEAAGATPGATLRDALRTLRHAANEDPVLSDALRAAEDAAFGPEDVRGAASRALVEATESWLRG
jgi:hypothetical protein